MHNCDGSVRREPLMGAGISVLSQSLVNCRFIADAGHSYPASVANCWNADCPDASNCRLRIMWATSMPSRVAEAEMKDLKPFICRVSFLMNLWSCSMMFTLGQTGYPAVQWLRYFVRRTVINQHQPHITSRQFILNRPAVFDPLLSITTLSGRRYCRSLL